MAERGPDAFPSRVGYLGMGIMGAPMAANLLAAGVRVSVWNRTAWKCDALVERGAVRAASPAAMAASDVEVIFVNVTDTPDVEALLFGDAGVAEGSRDGLLVVDHSTIDPVATRDFAARLAERGVKLLDAPVSGGDTGAKAGTLSVMVGGDAGAFERVRPLLEIVGGRVTHLGPSGAGQTCKACNQICGAVNLVGAIEAMTLAKASGLDVDRMIEVVGAGAGGSWQLSNLGPKIAADDHAPGFMIDLLLKDLGIVSRAGRSAGAPLPVTAIAESLFRAASRAGLGRQGTQAVAQVIERLAAVRLAGPDES